ncbi:2-octaprenylphenol hydroxylase of ubiquinone biosynthetic pathway [Acinetobacter pittii PHEA-2]|uniref:2-octaprenylphenol hydroxylase of ubiquinone biosynthetic pathway n=1 Tax=Acinetobacter pittii (strain PHEA-2) TaxID=871585 RepID=F0KLC8_ACIP2|nr:MULTISPECIES: AarF/UbiB family protein [Acinetobacter]YP_004997527.1 ubiquinone biosynthetic 2-octaprenylphenol hydroxylase [Acinetobacter pittii PHEA-2]ADY83845.1 2-octaprenylphenol hydroxylase of ubiquinone biosynthetic pathway [Acinetobacter pittii PHEA-2]KRI61952.1 2-octaprenylphenol hydroxylase [Acinetobacter pittii]MBJ8479021.1 2-octaprenylphenol hydroxylase [Acinetobacter pittii]MBJ9936225.1 2-octaprenylphenol hydroxylase [Acinetobacter pittii]MBN6517350.1 2-octaprenylphenol hydroxy
MIPHVSRLLELWRIAAHYRLDTLFPADELPVKAQHALNIIKMHPAAWSSRERKNPLKLKEALEDMGPLAIKLGQLLSTRRDLIPPEVLAQLVLLQDQVKPFDGDVAKQRIQDSLKADVNTLFARFDDQPLAAASIAQVHTAALHDGREVVVKVTRPDIRNQILQDFEILAWLGNTLESRLEAARALHLTEIIQDYRQIILNELDLSIEADNTRRMRHYFTGSTMMYVPEVYMDTKDVMVAERITGVPISDTATFDRLGMDRAQLAEKGLTIFFTQVFRDNFFHADMHPGNVFVETINPSNPRFIALDCAIMGELSKHDQMTVARMLLAVMNSNFMQLIQIVHQAGWIPPGTDQDALAREMRRTVGPMVSKPMDQLDFAGILIQVMDIARRFHLEIPPQLMLLLKTLVHVEGLGTDLYPQLDIWKLAKPILTEWVKSNMNPVKNVKELGQQLPDLLLGAQDFPSLIIDSLNGLKNQSAWQDRQLREIQQLRLQMEHQQRRSWMFGSTMLILLTIAIISPWFVSIILIVLSSLLALWRILK